MAVLDAAIIPREGRTAAVRAALDSPPLRRLAEAMETPRGRRGYGSRALLGACLVKAVYGLATWADTDRLIRDHPGLQAVLGCCPSRFACYRFSRRLIAQPRLVEKTAPRGSYGRSKPVTQPSGRMSRLTPQTSPPGPTGSATGTGAAQSVKRSAIPTRPGATGQPCPRGRAEGSTGTSSTSRCAPGQVSPWRGMS